MTEVELARAKIQSLLRLQMARCKDSGELFNAVVHDLEMLVLGRDIVTGDELSREHMQRLAMAVLDYVTVLWEREDKNNV